MSLMKFLFLGLSSLIYELKDAIKWKVGLMTLQHNQVELLWSSCEMIITWSISQFVHARSTWSILYKHWMCHNMSTINQIQEDL